MALTTVDQGLLGTYAQYTGYKNRIFNGAMMIDQRNAGASVSSNNGVYSLDRWLMRSSQSGKFNVQRNAGSVTPPVGFSYYMGITSTSAYSLLSTDYFFMTQVVEGFNWADLAWGTANASPVTLSFWVRSSLTGTFGGALRNAQSSTYGSYGFTYTINSANTWEYKTIAVTGAGTSTSGWVSDNNGAVELNIGLGVGSTYTGAGGSWVNSNVISTTGATSVVGTNGATFYITGVQLEKGSTATSFDYRPYGTELQLCQRYYQYIGGFKSGGICNGTANVLFACDLPVSLRTTSPSYTLLLTSWAAAPTNYYALDGAGNWIGNSGASINGFNCATTTNIEFQIAGFSGLTSGRLIYLNYGNNLISLSAEL